MIVPLNMDGRRFGGGLLAGLLLALALVLGPALASGSLGGVPGFSPSGNKEVSQAMVTTTTVTEAATTSAPAYSGVGNPPPNSTVTSTATSQTATSATSQSSTQIPQPAFADLSPPPSADKLSNLPTEPPLLAILVLIPVLVALFAGGLLYRASKPKFSSEDED